MSSFLLTLTARLGKPLTRLDSASGGCIHEAFSARLGEEKVFVKTGDASRLAMFEAEADGLAALSQAGSHRIPEVIAVGEAEGSSYLILEWLELSPVRGREEGATCGRALVEMHRRTGPNFGWHRDNIIGATAQENGFADSWGRFFSLQRIKPQIDLAKRNGAPKDFIADGEKLVDAVPALLLEHQPVPSLLHGDLWHGNAGFASGRPALFDPAVYFGDREADLAMSELFGGFPESFYAAYREAWPLPEGYERRKTLYNFYHILNHYNLFGAAYLGQAKRMIARLLAEARGR